MARRWQGERHLELGLRTGHLCDMGQLTLRCGASVTLSIKQDTSTHPKDVGKIKQESRANTRRVWTLSSRESV